MPLQKPLKSVKCEPGILSCFQCSKKCFNVDISKCSICRQKNDSVKLRETDVGYHPLCKKCFKHGYRFMTYNYGEWNKTEQYQV